MRHGVVEVEGGLEGGRHVVELEGGSAPHTKLGPSDSEEGPEQP